MRSILFFVSAIFWSTQLQAFDLNVTRDEVRRVIYGYLIGDLLVGDKAYVSNLDFCEKDNQLFLIKSMSTDEKAEYWPNLIAEVLPNNMVNITLQADYKKHLDEVSHVVPNTDPCEYFEAFLMTSGYFAVKSIQGHQNMRDYIGFLKEAGFKLEVDLN